MSRKKTNIAGSEGYKELLQALEFDGKRLESITQETIEKLDQMLDNDLFHRTNINTIQFLARESVVNVPTLDDNNSAHLVIKCNERIEILVEHVKYQGFVFIENAEKIRGLIDLNVMYSNRVDYETQLCWKNEIVQMQGQISANQMNILDYYRNRSDIGLNILKQPRISDYWEQLIEIDEDFFYKLRMILFNLRLFYLNLFHIVYQWTHFSNKSLTL